MESENQDHETCGGIGCFVGLGPWLARPRSPPMDQAWKPVRGRIRVQCPQIQRVTVPLVFHGEKGARRVQCAATRLRKGARAFPAGWFRRYGAVPMIETSGLVRRSWPPSVTGCRAPPCFSRFAPSTRRNRRSRRSRVELFPHPGRR